MAIDHHATRAAGTLSATHAGGFEAKCVTQNIQQGLSWLVLH
jgi:hypothetical protein